MTQVHETLTFTVLRPIGQNEAYRRSAQGRMFMTVTAKAFKARCAQGALVAKAATSWPRDLAFVARVRLSYQIYDCPRLDADSPCKLVRDSFEGVLYRNDKICEDGPHPLPIQDGKGCRIAITIELLEVRSEEEAKAERAAHNKRAQANLRRRNNRQKAKAS